MAIGGRPCQLLRLLSLILLPPVFPTGNRGISIGYT